MSAGANWETYLRKIVGGGTELPKPPEKQQLPADEDGEQVDELYMTRPNPVSINAENGDVFRAMADAYAINNKQSVFDRQAVFHTNSQEVKVKSVDTTDM